MEMSEVCWLKVFLMWCNRVNIVWSALSRSYPCDMMWKILSIQLARSQGRLRSWSSALHSESCPTLLSTAIWQLCTGLNINANILSLKLSSFDHMLLKYSVGPLCRNKATSLLRMSFLVFFYCHKWGYCKYVVVDILLSTLYAYIPLSMRAYTTHLGSRWEGWILMMIHDIYT